MTRNPPGLALTPKQHRFVAEYLVDANAAGAARRAGYSPKTASAIGAENLTKPAVAAAIREAQAKLEAKTEITKAYVVKHTVEILHGAMTDRAWAAARGAADLLARLHGHIVERKDVRVIRSIEDLSDEEVAALAAGNGMRH